MDGSFLLYYFILPIAIAIYVSRKYAVSFLQIIILSALPVLFISILPIIAILGDPDEPVPLISIFFMYYLMLFVPLMLSSIIIIYLKKVYSLPLYKLLLVTALVALSSMSIFALIAKLEFDFWILLGAIITGILSVSILHYFTDIRGK